MKATTDEFDALRIAGTLILFRRLLDQQLRQDRDEQPLSMAELNVLGQIDRGNGLPSAIARAMALDPPRVTRITDHLVALGYVTRAEDAADRRRCVLQLTNAGRDRVEAGRAQIAAIVTSLLDGLSPAEREGLVRGLQAVRNLMDAGVSVAV